MIDKTSNEVLAVGNAKQTAGEVIDEAISAGEGSDVAKWTFERYAQFIEAAIDGYQDRLQVLAVASRDRVPF